MWPPIRVYIVGPQKNFCHVLAANVQCWGYETVLIPSMTTLCKGAGERGVVICDLDDDSFRSIMGKSDTSALQLPGWDSQQDARLMIVLSSHSVSRMTLERLGAAALLQKPFEMGCLQRYLRIMLRLLVSRSQEETALHVRSVNEKLRILVVDDDRDIAQNVCCCLLHETGYEVAVAHDGLEALERYLDWLPHCIVTDLIMPWMNGYQVIRCVVHGSERTMPTFVVMSALTQLEVPVDRSYLQGKKVAYVDKPFHIEHLLAAIRQVCAG